MLDKRLARGRGRSWPLVNLGVSFRTDRTLHCPMPRSGATSATRVAISLWRATDTHTCYRTDVAPLFHRDKAGLGADPATGSRYTNRDRASG